VPTRVTRLTRAGPQPCAAAKLAILASNQETPGSGPGGSARFPQWPSGAEGASRTRKPRGLSSRGMPIPFTPAWCATRDLNPDRHRLRACRSAIELAARGADDRNRTGIHCLEGSNTSHCVTSAWGLPEVATLPLLLFRQPLIVSAREPWSGSPESNRVSPESESGRLPSSSIPKRGPPRTRTAHLLLAGQALSQMS
jgi:hypothetical protein